MNTYYRLLDVASRDYIVMLSHLDRARLRAVEMALPTADILLCIDDDGDEIGWTVLFVDDDHESLVSGRICGLVAMQTEGDDLKRALSSLLNQCLQRVVDLGEH